MCKKRESTPKRVSFFVLLLFLFYGSACLLSSLKLAHLKTMTLREGRAVAWEVCLCVCVCACVSLPAQRIKSYCPLL